MVAVISEAINFNINRPGVPITVIPDDSDVGILSDSTEYDVVIGGVFIQNTGRGYVNPTINIYDRDKERTNGDAQLVVVDGRIVEVIIRDNGTGFLRIPELRVTDENGYGANLYPIMNIIPRG